MKRTKASCSVPLGTLVDYLLGELSDAEAEHLEEHLFGCPVCADRMDSIHTIGVSVAAAARRGAISGNVTGAFLERALGDGLKLREYRIRAGETVPCRAGPEDVVVVRLAGDFSHVSDLVMEVAFLDLESGEPAPVERRQVDADRDAGEVILAFPGEVIRALPRSQWTITLRGQSPSGSAELGQFIMDHTP